MYVFSDLQKNQLSDQTMSFQTSSQPSLFENSPFTNLPGKYTLFILFFEIWLLWNSKLVYILADNAFATPGLLMPTSSVTHTNQPLGAMNMHQQSANNPSLESSLANVMANLTVSGER